MPVPAMLDGLGFLVPPERRITPDVDIVDVDIALPGRDEPPGVTSPDRDPIFFFWINTSIYNQVINNIELVCTATNSQLKDKLLLSIKINTPPANNTTT